MSDATTPPPATDPSPGARDLALQIIHATEGNPKRANEAAILIDAFRREGVEKERARCIAAATTVADALLARADEYNDQENYDLYEQFEGHASAAVEVRDRIHSGDPA